MRKRKSKGLQPIVQMDGNEYWHQKKGVVRYLWQKGVKLVTSGMYAGDYLVVGRKDSFIFERKSLKDLCKTILQDRLGEQLLKLKAASDEYQYTPVLLVETNRSAGGHLIPVQDFNYPLTSVESSVNLNDWIGLSAGVKVLLTESKRGTADFLAGLAERVRSIDPDDYPNRLISPRVAPNEAKIERLNAELHTMFIADKLFLDSRAMVYELDGLAGWRIGDV